MLSDNKEQLKLFSDKRLGYQPTVTHRVWVEQAAHEFDVGMPAWRVAAQLDYGQDDDRSSQVMKSKRTYDDMFEAINFAWRIALTVRDVHHKTRFIQVCAEAHDMHEQNALIGLSHMPDASFLRKAVRA